MKPVADYICRLSYVMWIGAFMLMTGREIGQLGANSVRAQYEIQKQLQAEFLQAIQASGMEIHMAPEPPTKG